MVPGSIVEQHLGPTRNLQGEGCALYPTFFAWNTKVGVFQYEIKIYSLRQNGLAYFSWLKKDIKPNEAVTFET